MSALARLIPEPRLVEIDHVDLGVPPAAAWKAIRQGELMRSPLARVLFAGTSATPNVVRLDELTGSRAPGFRILAEEARREVAVGAIAKIYDGECKFVDVHNERDFVRFADPGYTKIAWALEISPLGDGSSRLTIELRVATTDDDSWRACRTFFRHIGPSSRMIRRIESDTLAAELASVRSPDNERALPGDELLPDALGQATTGIDVSATPAQIWPWLVQMGCRLDAEPGVERLEVGDVVLSTAEGDDGFEVLRVDPQRAIVLGALFDLATGKRLRFSTRRPAAYWQVTWAFVLEARDDTTTHVHARASATCSQNARLPAVLRCPVHHFMEPAQLRRLKERSEGRPARGGWRDVPEGVVGAAGIALDLLTPFLRHAPSIWGIDDLQVERAHPGDLLIAEPRWSWTHAIEIDAPPAAVWPWVAQLGADRAGFYTSQWLENLAGSDVLLTNELNPEWELRAGDWLRLHTRTPPLEVVAIEPGDHFVAYGPPDPSAPAENRPWAAVTWVFLVEPRPRGRSRVVSRFRVACSDDLAQRFAYGPWTTESVGFAMDRRVLMGLKERAERRAKAPRGAK